MSFRTDRPRQASAIASTQARCSSRPEEIIFQTGSVEALPKVRFGRAEVGVPEPAAIQAGGQLAFAFPYAASFIMPESAVYASTQA